MGALGFPPPLPLPEFLNFNSDFNSDMSPDPDSASQLMDFLPSTPYHGTKKALDTPMARMMTMPYTARGKWSRNRMTMRLGRVMASPENRAAFFPNLTMTACQRKVQAMVATRSVAMM